MSRITFTASPVKDDCSPGTCSSIHSIEGLSAHADPSALLGWARAFQRPPARTFVVHGEPSASQTFADALRQNLDWMVAVPTLGNPENWAVTAMAP